jgi:prepilin-type N-terminal cleavage/methylation domain-containing protein
MPSTFTCHHKRERGFSILEMMLATVILLIGLVAIAQLVPATILLNFRNRTDSSALVFAQRELDQLVDQPLSSSSFTDALGNTCQLGNSAVRNSVQGSTVVSFNNQPVIAFGSPPPSLAPTNGYGFLYVDPTNPNGTVYDVRWAVILTGDGTSANVSSKRFILGIRQYGGNGYFQPITLDTLVEK